MERIYQITYRGAVMRSDLPHLSSAARVRIHEAIESKLSSRPELFSFPLRWSLKGLRKLRVGNYRIVFLIQPQDTVHIIAIRHRSNIYTITSERVSN